MANKIRGITLEIGGDTSGLQSSLKQVNTELNSTQRQLKDVDRLLKLDPGNVDLLQQKQQLLGRAVEQTSDKLEDLTAIQKAFVDGGGDVNSDAYMALEREIIATQRNLDAATESADNFNATTAQASASFEQIGSKAEIVAEKTEKLSKAAQGVLAAAGGAAVVSIKQFADYEQSLGGVETFFKESSDVVVQYANEAYKTAGMSANQYMQTITGFAAALLSSLNGNTRAAAEMANIAIVDMSDNANKFGTDISSIQSAYQGFAKGNYTMLDNLKLGFAGNKQGMEELLAEAEKLTGVKFDINSFSDIVIAIHEVQESMGIAGTTSEEASTTISGSINTLKAAVEDLALGFATADADVDQLTANASEAFQQVLANIQPVISQILDSLPDWAKLGLAIVAVAAAISPIASIVGTVSAVFRALTPILSAASMAMFGFELSSLGVVAAVVAIAAAIAALILIIKKLKEARDNLGSSPSIGNVGTLPYTPGMASGGVLSSGTALVGERGPELLTMSNGAAVVQPLTNNYTTNNYTAAPAGGSSQPIDVTLLLDSATLARVMVQPNARAVSLAGESAIH